MKTSKKLTFLMTIQNEIGIFRSALSDTLEESKNYQLVSCVEHDIKDINTAPEYIYYLIKARKIRLAKNDIVYIKYNLHNRVYKFTGSEINALSDLVDNLIRITNFDTNEINIFLNKLRLNNQVYDSITGNVYLISNIIASKAYYIKESDAETSLYELGRLDKRNEHENQLFKYATTFSNILYEFYKKLNEESDLILINKNRISSINI